MAFMRALDGATAPLTQHRALVPAIAGMALLWLSTSSLRFSTRSDIFPVGYVLLARHAIAAIVVLLVLVFLRRRSRRGMTNATVLARPPLFTRIAFVSVTLAVLCACFVGRYVDVLAGSHPSTLSDLCSMAAEALSYLPIFAWMWALLPYGRTATLATLGASVLALSGLQLILSCFQELPYLILVCLSPLAEAVLYARFSTAASIDSAGASDHVPTPTHDQRGDAPQPMVTHAGARMSAVLLVFILCMQLTAGRIIFVSLDVQQMMSSSAFSSISIAIGNLLGGLFVLLASDRLKRGPSIAVALFSAFAAVALAFYFATFVDGVAVALHLVLSNFALQITTALVFLFPFVKGSSDKPTSFALAFSVHTGARVISAACMIIQTATSGTMVYDVIVAVAMLLMIACCGAVLVSDTTPVNVSEAKGEGPDVSEDLADVSVPSISKDDASSSRGAHAGDRVVTPFKTAISQIAEEHSLTPQEERVLTLLAQGRNAKAIADVLCVTLNTSKSHMRSLYAKMNVHSQQELIDCVNERVAATRASTPR